MSLIIFTTKQDLALRNTKQAKIYFYENLKKFNFKINKQDKIILRDPYNAGVDYSSSFRKILNKYYSQILLDRECYKNFPNYEDKLFQAKFFQKHKIPAPKFFTNAIIKKRISSRNKGNFIINSKYFVQEYIDFKQDIRILILKNKILGIVQKKNNKIFKIANLPSKIKNQALKLVRLFKADFAGIDVIKSKNNKYYFLEINLSPQFKAFEKITKIDVVQEIIKTQKPREGGQKFI